MRSKRDIQYSHQRLQTKMVAKRTKEFFVVVVLFCFLLYTVEGCHLNQLPILKPDCWE